MNYLTDSLFSYGILVFYKNLLGLKDICVYDSMLDTFWSNTTDLLL
jgi:hypothetical protein